MNQLSSLITIENLEKYLDEVKQNYRPYDPANYLYKIILSKPLKERLTSDGIELIYTTLSAWNMNARGAKLAEFEDFKSSIINNKDLITDLEKYKLGEFSDSDLVMSKFEKLFNNTKLVGYNKNGKEKPRLITFAKTMHFLLPELAMPIDRKYTLKLFYGHGNVPKPLHLQFKKYKKVFLEFHEFAKNNNLQPYKDNNWNSNIPKIIDNLIIGYIRGKS